VNRRNWLDLSRKLVDRFDLDYTVSAVVQAIDHEMLALPGFGILPTHNFPNPFVITPNGAALTVGVGAGVAHDVNGQQIYVGTAQVSPAFAADPTNPTKALLVLQYAAVGDTPVPKPSDPITTVNLNLHDSFVLIVRLGVPSVTPVYPATQPGDVVLQGVTIPAAATNSAAFTYDASVQNYAAILNNTYDAITGTGPFATDVNLAAAVLRLGQQTSPNAKRILVSMSEALAATLNITNNDWTFEFKPGVTVSDGGAGTGFNVTGTGCKFKEGRFLGFTVTAINFQAAANYGLTAFNRFNTCTDEVTDTSSAGPNPAIGNISE
jgi:hypothetical protein